MARDPLFNPSDPSFRADPYPYYRRLRESVPVWRSPLGFWVVSRHRDVAALLRDQRIGHSDATAFGNRGAMGPDGRPLNSFLRMNAPEHTRLRRLVSRVFTPRSVERLRPHIQRLVDALLSDALEGGEVDLIAALAHPLPLTVICELLGIPQADRERFTEWMDVLVKETDLGRRPEAELARAAQASSDYFLALAAERRRSPRDDLFSALATLEDQGDTLSEAELVGTCNLLLSAGYETTVNLIGNGVLALLRHPDQLAYLRAHPEQAPAAIEEFLRYDAPTQLTIRVALDDVEVGEQQIARGERMLPLIGAANRDPEAFHDPDRLDVTRSDNPHLAFGAGIHFCLGAPLARLEAQIAVTTLLQRAPALTLVKDDPPYRDNYVLRGPEALPVRLF